MSALPPLLYLFGVIADLARVVRSSACSPAPRRRSSPHAARSSSRPTSPSPSPWAPMVASPLALVSHLSTQSRPARASSTRTTAAPSTSSSSTTESRSSRSSRATESLSSSWRRSSTLRWLRLPSVFPLACPALLPRALLPATPALTSLYFLSPGARGHRARIWRLWLNRWIRSQGRRSRREDPSISMSS